MAGISNQCSYQDTKQLTEQLITYSGSKGYCIEIGNGIWTSWLCLYKNKYDKVEIVCDKVKNIYELRKGYNIVALSQGTLIGRGVVELCNGGPPVKNFISLAGPHGGISTLPLCGSGGLCDQVNKLIKSGSYSNYVQARLAPSGYLKLPNRNPTRKQQFSRLKNLVFIMFQNDTVLVPKETSWFGFYPDGAQRQVLPPQQTKLYIEDWIGLKTLDRAGKVKYISVPGNHVKISQNDLMMYVVLYLKEIKHPKRVDDVGKFSKQRWLGRNHPSKILHQL